MMVIEGININNAIEVFNAGACGIDVVDAIHNALDPYEAAKELITSANHYSYSTSKKLSHQI